MKNHSYADEIAASMAATLKDAEFQKIFSTQLTKKASAPEAEVIEIDEESDLVSQEMIAEASSPRADCLNCGKTRPNWSEPEGLCKCAANGCSILTGCKDDCSCGCKKKQASFDGLIKSAFAALMKVSEELDEAGLEELSTDTLVLANELVVEAKAKKDDKAKAKADKEKQKAAKEKEAAKAKAAKEKEIADKNKAKDRAAKEKAREKAEKDKNAAKDKAMKDKAKSDKEKADKAKADKLKKK